MMSPSADANATRSLKIVIIGAPKSGKSSLMHSYNDLDFDPSYVPTVRSDFTAKEVEIDNTVVSAQIWDLGSAVTGTSLLRGTQGVLLVADMTSEQSLKVLNGLYENIKKLVGFADDSFPCVVVANKLDLINTKTTKQVTIDSLRRWASDRRVSASTPISFFEVSAKDGTNVNLMFESLFRMALNKPAKIGTPTTTQSPSSTTAFSPVHTPAMGNNLVASHKVRPSTPPELKEPDADDTGSEGGTGSVRKGKDDDDEFEDGEEEQAIAKVVIAGAASVGKTFILKRFVGDDRDHNDSKYEPTIGADLRIVDMPVKDRTLTLQIWDTSGNPKMLAMGRSIYRDADCLILVYDITSRSSFSALESYWEHYLTNAEPFEPEEFPVLLVGNKCDLSDRRAVTLEEVMDWCAVKRPRRPITYIECSALCSMGVSDIFVFVADAIYDYALAADTLHDTDDDEDDSEEEEFSSDGGSFETGGEVEDAPASQAGQAAAPRNGRNLTETSARR